MEEKRNGPVVASGRTMSGITASAETMGTAVELSFAPTDDLEIQRNRDSQSEIFYVTNALKPDDQTAVNPVGLLGSGTATLLRPRTAGLTQRANF